MDSLIKSRILKHSSRIILISTTLTFLMSYGCKSAGTNVQETDEGATETFAEAIGGDLTVTEFEETPAEMSMDIPSGDEAPEPEEVVLEKKVNIAADTNRDGKVMSGSSDETYEEEWTIAHGAIFIPNIDDDDGDGERDCDDLELNGSKDADDLATVIVEQLSWPGDGCHGEISINEAAIPHVRLFIKGASGWDLPAALSPMEIPCETIRNADLIMGLEGIHYMGEKGFDGLVELTFRLFGSDGGLEGSDSVVLRAAPFIMASELEKHDTVYAAHAKSSQTAFMQQLQTLVEEAGCGFVKVGDLGIPLSASIGSDIWMQDAVEIGFSAAPGADKPRVISVALQAPRGKQLDIVSKDFLLSGDFGWLDLAKPRANTFWFDWFGNLEVSPPVKVDGKDYPFGRIYTGHDPDDPVLWGMHPEIRKFLEIQGIQGPLIGIDTGWLYIAHVDEMIAWVKTSSGKGYRMLIASTEVTLDLLKGIKNAGDGSALMFAGKEDEISVSAFLASPLAGFNEEVQNRVDNTREQLKNELGLSEDDIVDIPCLFKKEGTYDKYAIALMPNMINSLIIGQHVIAPDPYGPIIGGKDRFKEALKERLEPLGQTVHFIDDWYPYHTWLGEIHCATNSKRLPDDAAWWK